MQNLIWKFYETVPYILPWVHVFGKRYEGWCKDHEINRWYEPWMEEIQTVGDMISQWGYMYIDRRRYLILKVMVHWFVQGRKTSKSSKHFKNGTW